MWGGGYFLPEKFSVDRRISRDNFKWGKRRGFPSIT